jgi:hypothetical protein
MFRLQRGQPGTGIIKMRAPLAPGCRRLDVRKLIMSALTVLLIALTLVLLGALPAWPYSREWGFYPSGITGAAMVVLIGLLLVGRFATA